MIFPQPDLTAPSAVQPASTLSVANALLALAPQRIMAFSFPLGAYLSASGATPLAEVGTYGTAALNNVNGTTYYVNGTVTVLPLTLAAGDTLRVDIAPNNYARGAYVILTA